MPRVDISPQSLCLCLSVIGLDGMTVLGGTLPSEWTSMTRLRSLSLSLNGPGYYGFLPSAWSSLAGLQYLSISNGSFMGGLPAEWAKHYNLKELRLQNITVDRFSTLPSIWAQNMVALGTLVLEDVRGVSGSLPSSWLVSYKNLTVLHIKLMPALNITVDQISSLMQAENLGGLEDLAVEGCNVTGNIPAIAGRLVEHLPSRLGSMPHT